MDDVAPDEIRHLDRFAGIERIDETLGVEVDASDLEPSSPAFAGNTTEQPARGRKHLLHCVEGDFVDEMTGRVLTSFD